MARMTKSPAILVLVLLVISAVFAYYFYAYEGFRNLDCKGVTCTEGQFCQSNTCHPIYPPTSRTPE